MKIFLAYGYNERDRWVEELVKPLISAFGAECVTGEGSWSASIPDSVQRKIRSADGLIGMLTRRDPATHDTHAWVLQELAVARALGRPAVSVREAGVDPQLGMLGDHHQISYDPAARDRCLLQIAQALGDMTASSGKWLLLPQALGEDIRTARAEAHCEFTVRDGPDEYSGGPAKLITQPGGTVSVNYTGVPRDALVKLIVRCNGHTWRSEYYWMNAFPIHLSMEKV
jgi:hypothetical protein